MLFWRAPTLFLFFLVFYGPCFPCRVLIEDPAI